MVQTARPCTGATQRMHAAPYQALSAPLRPGQEARTGRRKRLLDDGVAVHLILAAQLQPSVFVSNPIQISFLIISHFQQFFMLTCYYQYLLHVDICSTLTHRRCLYQHVAITHFAH